MKGKTDLKKQEIELLSPAGSYEGFEAAIGAGADAVYVGGPDFGARAYAQNFTQEELIRAIRTAHIHGRKLYLTVNTLLKNREIKEKLFDSLKPLYEAGLLLSRISVCSSLSAGIFRRCISMPVRRWQLPVRRE